MKVVRRCALKPDSIDNTVGELCHVSVELRWNNDYQSQVQ